MKKLIMILCLTLILGGCLNSKSADKRINNERYENFMELLIDNSNQVSTDIPFEWDFRMFQSDEGYDYELKIFNPKVAMGNIQMICANIEEISETMIAPSIGIFEEDSYNMLPNQVNVEKGYYEGLGLSGNCRESQFILNCLVVYKDKNQSDNYVYFMVHANYDDYAGQEEVENNE